MPCLDSGAARCRPACAQGPAIPQRRAVTNLDRHAVAVFVHLHPKRIGFVKNKRVIFGIARSKYGHRFTGGEDMTADVALREQMYRDRAFSRALHANSSPAGRPL